MTSSSSSNFYPRIYIYIYIQCSNISRHDSDLTTSWYKVDAWEIHITSIEKTCTEYLLGIYSREIIGRSETSIGQIISGAEHFSRISSGQERNGRYNQWYQGKSGTWNSVCSCFMEHDKESFAKFAPLSDNNATLLQQHVQLSMESNSPADLFDVYVRTYVLEMWFYSPLPIPGLDNKTQTKRNVPRTCCNESIPRIKFSKYAWCEINRENFLFSPSPTRKEKFVKIPCK